MPEPTPEPTPEPQPEPVPVPEIEATAQLAPPPPESWPPTLWVTLAWVNYGSKSGWRVFGPFADYDAAQAHARSLSVRFPQHRRYLVQIHK